MAEAQYQDFDRRMRRIVKRHKKLANGYVPSVNHDGLVIARPRRRPPSISFKGFFFLFVSLIGFKVMLFVALGPATYAERVVKLQNGTMLEQVGAFVMTPEPVTLWIAEQYALLTK